jgi:hypothetical protein
MAFGRHGLSIEEDDDLLYVSKGLIERRLKKLADEMRLRIA